MANLREQALSWGLGVAILLAPGLVEPAAAQSTQPVWYPPLSLYGRPIAQPYFDFPNWARYSYCRPAPLAWGFDPFPDYGPCDEGSAFGVPSVNCPGDFVAHRPRRFYGSADFAPTTYDHQRDVEIARADGITVLSTSELRPEFDAAGKYTIGMRLLDCYRLEGTYWGALEWDDAAVVQRNDADIQTLLSGGFGNGVDPALDENSLVEIRSQSRMNSAEMNLLYWIDMPPGGLDVSLLVGGRHLRIEEQFNLSGDIAGDLDVVAENDLWCLQVGLVSDWLVHSRFWVHFDLKGAICTNDITLENTVDSVAAPGARQDRTSWLGDLSLVANWQVTPWLVARLGYQALFVDSVAIAAQSIQTNNTFLLSGPAQINDSGNLAFHGPIIGLMGVW